VLTRTTVETALKAGRRARGGVCSARAGTPHFIGEYHFLGKGLVRGPSPLASRKWNCFATPEFSR
jgi:hypothetical protein